MAIFSIDKCESDYQRNLFGSRYLIQVNLQALSIGPRAVMHEVAVRSQLQVLHHSGHRFWTTCCRAAKTSLATMERRFAAKAAYEASRTTSAASTAAATRHFCALSCKQPRHLSRAPLATLFLAHLNLAETFLEG